MGKKAEILRSYVESSKKRGKKQPCQPLLAEMCLRIFQKNIPFCPSVRVPAQPSIHRHKPLPPSWVSACFTQTPHTHTHTHTLSWPPLSKETEETHQDHSHCLAEMLQVSVLDRGRPGAPELRPSISPEGKPTLGPCSISGTTSHLRLPQTCPQHPCSGQLW